MSYTDQLAEQNRERARQHQHQNLVGRYCVCLGRAKGSPYAAADTAQRSYPHVQPLEASFAALQKTAVEAGDSQTIGWAKEWRKNPSLVAFMDQLRARTIIDRLPGVRRVPLNVSVPTQSSGGTFQWIGESLAKPVGSMSFSNSTLYWSKVSGILGITRELVEFGGDEVAAIIENDLAQGAADFINSEFVSATNAPQDYISPGGIVYGINATTSSVGATAAAFRTDVKNLITALAATVKDLRNVAILMTPQNAINLALMDAAFSGITADGGSFAGLTVLTSSTIGNRLIGIDGGSLLLADNGTDIAVSSESSVEFDTMPAVGETSPLSQVGVMHSAWQHNLILYRVDRFVNWKLGRSGTVKWISGVAYGS
jgi:hypothetical protein